MAPPPGTAAGDAAGGLLGSLSDRLATREEAERLRELRRELAADLAEVPAFPELVSDQRLLRSLRGFEHSVPEAAKAFRNHLELRKRHGLDAVRERLAEEWRGRLWELRLESLPHGEVVCSFMPEVMIFTAAKNGDPVSLGLWGRGRPADFMRSVPQWREHFQEFFMAVAEARMLLLEEATREQGRLAHFQWVFDLQDWSIMGNSNREWTKFCMEVTGPVAMSYHDVASRYYTVRTTQMARMAYSVIKPVIPKRVSQKVTLLGSDFHRTPEIRELIDEPVLASLAEGRVDLGPRRREGQAVIQSSGSFALRVDVPPGGRVRWNFGLERADCFGGIRPGGLTFSVARCRGASGEEAADYVGGQEPRALSAMRGHLGPSELWEDEGGEAGCTLELRWRNGHAFFLPGRLSYRVDVECPAAAAKPAEAPASRGPPLLALTLAFCIMILSILLRCL